MKALMIAAVLLCAGAGAAKASPPAGWPGDTWACNPPFAGAFCLKLRSTSTAIPLYLEATSTATAGFASAQSGIAFVMNSVTGIGGTAYSSTNIGFSSGSLGNNGFEGVTGDISHAGIVGRSQVAGGLAGAFDHDVYTAGSYLSGSTRDLKDAIGPLKRGLADVLKTRPSSYLLKADPGGRRHFGFIAEEMKDAIPEVVVTNPMDGSLAIDYSALTAVLALAIQQDHEERAAQAQLVGGGCGAAALLLGLGGVALRRARRRSA